MFQRTGNTKQGREGAAVPEENTPGQQGRELRPPSQPQTHGSGGDPDFATAN